MLKIHTFETFDLERIDSDIGRRYRLPNGNLYESVTEAISKYDVEGQRSIAEWKNRVGEKKANDISRIAATRGTRAHGLMEQYLNSFVHRQSLNSVFEKQMPDTIDLFHQWKKYIDYGLTEIYTVEQSLYSDTYRLAGTPDCVGVFLGRPSIIDFKNSGKEKKREWIKNYFLQATAYATMFEERYGQSIESIVILVAIPFSNNGQLFLDTPSNFINDDFFRSRI